MRIRIQPDGSHQKVTVSEGDDILATFPAASLAQAHKLIAIGRSGGWDQVATKPLKAPKKKGV